jgi:hypothetical protein
MASKPEFEGVELKARYNRNVKNDRDNTFVIMHIQPDYGEDDYRDYQLSKAVSPQPLCVGDVKYNHLVVYIENGLRKRLVKVWSPMKVGIYRLGYCRSPRLFEERCAERKRVIEATIAAEPAYASGQPRDREDRLFVLYPYYRAPYPRRRDEMSVRLYTLTTPCEPISLVEPDWDIWQPAPEMDRWVRSLPFYSSAV